jgi:AraC-like DNA-binding protein
MFLLFPGEWHSYRPDKESGWNEFWIGFSGPVVDSRIQNGFFTKDKPVFQVGIHNEIVDLYTNAIDTASNQESGFQPLLGSIVIHLLGLTYFYDRNEAFRSTEVSDMVNRAKILISEQYRTIRPEDIADALCMGYSNFRKIFREYTGFSPAKYIQEVRFSKAKELLTNSSMSVKEIAIELGFENYEYFFTAFKRLAGMTPADYRAMTRGKYL